MLVLTSLLFGCTSTNESASSACIESNNLLQGTDFKILEDRSFPWLQRQHARQSYEASVDDSGVLSITQKGNEPWFIYYQRVEDPRLAGNIIRYSADLQGQVNVEPKFHGFPHLAGLYYVPAKGTKRLSSYSKVAEHTPNGGNWDWQRFTVEYRVPVTASVVEVGFVHQARGTIMARNPELVVVECAGDSAFKQDGVGF